MISPVIRFMKQRGFPDKKEFSFVIINSSCISSLPTAFELASSHNPMSKILKVIPPYFIHIDVHVYIYMYICISYGSICLENEP